VMSAELTTPHPSDSPAAGCYHLSHTSSPTISRVAATDVASALLHRSSQLLLTTVKNVYLTDVNVYVFDIKIDVCKPLSILFLP
jgi:hypothetical protein